MESTSLLEESTSPLEEEPLSPSRMINPSSYSTKYILNSHLINSESTIALCSKYVLSTSIYPCFLTNYIDTGIYSAQVPKYPLKLIRSMTNEDYEDNEVCYSYFDSHSSFLNLEDSSRQTDTMKNIISSIRTIHS